MNLIAIFFQLCFTQMKWKIDGSSAHKHERTLQFFTFFTAIYSTYSGSARKKIEPDFLMCACADYNIIIFPGKYVHIYIIGSRGANEYGGFAGSWRLELTMDIYYLGRIQTRLKSAQAARHGYDAICAHNLFTVYHIDKFSADSCTLFYDGKMCKCI